MWVTIAALIISVLPFLLSAEARTVVTQVCIIALHHHPVDGPRQVNICRQEHNVYSAECCNGLVGCK